MAALTISLVGFEGVRPDEVFERINRPTPLVLDDPSQTMIAQLKAEAEAAPIGHEAMARLAAEYEQGRRHPPLQMEQQTIKIIFGWTITYTIEEHKPGVPCRHFSMAAPNRERMPLPAAIEMLLPYFGFKGGLKNAAVYPEHMENGGVAINVIQPMSGDMSEIMITE